MILLKTRSFIYWKYKHFFVYCADKIGHLQSQHLTSLDFLSNGTHFMCVFAGSRTE